MIAPRDWGRWLGFGMYRAITQGIEVTVEPEFSPERSNPERGDFFWIYTVEIRNLSTATVQLRARHWQITDGLGKVQHIRGPGVVGEQPVLKPGEMFRYSSGCPLRTEQGMMVGSYEMVMADGTRFEAAIPAFSLDMPNEKRVLN